MSDPLNTELRQIKQILLAILACLVVIVLALVPKLIPFVVVAGMLYALTVVVLAASQTARVAARQLWNEVSSLWRR